jgi:ubiquitin C-terminal hydrolase
LDTNYEEITRSVSSQRAVSLYDCLQDYCRVETLTENEQWYCNKCEDHKCASKKFDVWTLPEILIIQIKRFHQIGYRR